MTTKFQYMIHELKREHCHQKIMYIPSFACGMTLMALIHFKLPNRSRVSQVE